MLGMIRPPAFEDEEFADIRAHQVADNGDDVRFTFGQKARDGIAVLFVVEREPFDGAAQSVEGKWGGGHAGDYSVDAKPRQADFLVIRFSLQARKPSGVSIVTPDEWEMDFFLKLSHDCIRSELIDGRRHIMASFADIT